MSALRIKGGTVADLRTLNPTWKRDDGTRTCRQCKRVLPLEKFMQRIGKTAQYQAKTWCNRCREEARQRQRRLLRG